MHGYGAAPDLSQPNSVDVRDEGTFEWLDPSCRDYGAGAGMDHPLLVPGVKLLATGNGQEREAG
ncbi:hypothetical protein MESS2_980038 [Mesorhizobium metallidurans STM 2683]|uniref:Uncharacterized protein n=1 Tax=Mesorhizobium metallidurans STM 2683 TaxID=1297569 RepID=M5FBP5_9HYPH|nr:hypothetical protein MESS2_980038 [Mesorhizobium metallidurans STM 2683]